MVKTPLKRAFTVARGPHKRLCTHSHARIQSYGVLDHHTHPIRRAPLGGCRYGKKPPIRTSPLLQRMMSDEEEPKYSPLSFS